MGTGKIPRTIRMTVEGETQFVNSQQVKRRDDIVLDITTCH